MKKLLFFFASAAALFAIASCEETPEGPETPEIPAQIEVTLTNLVKGDIVAGEINKLPVTASAEGVELELNFYSDKVYLAAGTYTVGKAVGNYEGKVKTNVVEADIKSGTITVADDGNDGYTLTGTLRLDNEAGTLAKLNATGTLAYELPTEFFYTATTVADTTIYKIYDLENHQLAAAAVVGAEEGTFDVVEGTALPGEPDAGTWVWIDGFGTEIYLHGKVTISTSHGKKVFKFEDNHTRLFNNCEMKASITPVLIKSDNDAENIYATGPLAITVVPSPVHKDCFEITMKLFFWDGREFLSFVVVTPDNEYPWSEPKTGLGSVIVPYSYYTAYDPAAEELQGKQIKGRISPEGTCFYVANGVKKQVKASDGFYALANCGEQATESGNVKYSLVVFINGSYEAPAGLLEVCAGDDAMTKLYACLGYAL